MCIRLYRVLHVVLTTTISFISSLLTLRRGNVQSRLSGATVQRTKEPYDIGGAIMVARNDVFPTKWRRAKELQNPLKSQGSQSQKQKAFFHTPCFHCSELFQSWQCKIKSPEKKMVPSTWIIPFSKSLITMVMAWSKKNLKTHDFPGAGRANAQRLRGLVARGWRNNFPGWNGLILCRSQTLDIVAR